MNTDFQSPFFLAPAPLNGHSKAGALGRMPQLLLTLLCTLLLIGGAATSSRGQGTDFRQFANETGNEAWINSILQQNNSTYYEGTSTLQRLVLVGVPTTSGNRHVLHFSHQATKGNIHAYDFVTGYDQALADYAAITGAPFTGLSVSGTALGPQATVVMVDDLYNNNVPGPNRAVAAPASAAAYTSLPGAPAGNVGSKVALYDNGSTTKRGVQIYGSSAVTNAHLDLVGYSGGSDIYAEYDLYWDSASPNVLILLGGHLAVGGTGAANTLNYGPGLGAAAINGGPYHFKLDNVDGITLGSQDNQIKGADILTPPPPSCAFAGPASLCGGSSGTYTGPAGMDSYAWSFVNNTSGSTFGSLTTGPTVTVLGGATSGSFTLKLVTTRLGVTSTTTCQQTVAVGNVTASLDNPTITCNGSTATLTATGSGGTPPYQYSFNGGAFSLTNTIVASANVAYSVIAKDANGCTSPAATRTLSQPTAVGVSLDMPTILCNGGTTTLTASATGGTGAYEYSFNGGGFSTANTITASANVAYSVVARDANGCESPAAGRTLSQPTAVAVLLDNPTILCNGGTATLTATASGGAGAYEYSFNGGAFGSANTTTALAGTAYSVVARDANGCTSPVAGRTLTQPDVLNASASSTNETCAKTDGTATATVAGGTLPYAYAWRLAGQSTVVSTKSVATGLVAGDYTLTVTDANSCSTTAATKVVADNCLVQHCTLTQGGYGNGNGVICRYPSVRRTQLITTLLSSGGNLVLGVSGRSITYSAATAASAAQCIIDNMPAGGSAAALPGFGNVSGCNLPSSILKNGNFNNVLIGQTLSLSLNTRLDNTLAAVPLSAAMTSFGALSCDGPDPLDLTGTTKTIPASVMGNLSYLGATPTVGALLTLANKALGGASYANAGGNPSYAEISGAAGAINELFDNCRMFLNTTPTLALPKMAGSTGAALSAGSANQVLNAYPNPFSTNTTVEFSLPQTTHYSLVVYDLKGSVVAKVSSGEAQQGVRYSFNLGGSLQEGVYMARLVTEQFTQTIRLNLIK